MSSTTDDAVTLLGDLVSRQDEAIHLPSAALAIACVEYPDLELEPQLVRMAELADVAAEHLGGIDEADRLAGLSRVMFGELGFRANRDEYYDARNSFLNDVLERRLGIPITLSIVYMEIARGCGWAIEGVGFPGHFLVRDVTSSLLLDPFNKGVVVDEEHCRRLLAAQGIDAARWSQDFLRSVTNREILLRITNNLRRHYTLAADSSRLAQLDKMATILRDLCEEDFAQMVQ